MSKKYQSVIYSFVLYTVTLWEAKKFYNSEFNYLNGTLGKDEN